MRLSLTTASFATIAASLALAACGDDKSPSEAEEHEGSSPAVALTEVGKTRDGLQAALKTYTGGDHAKAEDEVAETYLQHFELVEGPLEERDEELTEDLEHDINEHLRADMRAGKPDAEITGAVKDIVAGLDKAEALLK